VFSLTILAAILGLGGYVWYMRHKIDKLEAQTIVQTADIKAADVHATGVADTNAKHQEANHEVRKALDANPVYRDSTVPAAVADRLRDRSGSE
jgi:hypothetical protein